MKLFEEFKLYENMWDNLTEKAEEVTKYFNEFNVDETNVEEGTYVQLLMAVLYYHINQKDEVGTVTACDIIDQYNRDNHIGFVYRETRKLNYFSNKTITDLFKVDFDSKTKKWTIKQNTDNASYNMVDRTGYGFNALVAQLSVNLFRLPRRDSGKLQQFFIR